MREEINNWWKQALADLRSAGNSIKSGDYYLAVFCCQQAVEKALKALHMLIQKESLPGHSLIYLAQKAKVPKELLSGIRDLNPEYLPTRYPDIAEGVPDELYDKEIALKHYKTAEEVLKWVEKQIQK